MAIDSESANQVDSDPGDKSLESLRESVAEMLLERLPDHYVNEKEWGKTKEVFDGVRLRREGWKLETERKWKRVKDGTWKRYELRLPTDKQAIALTVDRLEPTEHNRCHLELRCEAPLEAFGRVAIWERGVQIISVNADADARVRIRLTAEIGVRIDISRLPPDIVLDPQIVDARIELLDFRLNRVSQLHGPLAKHLGEGLREIVEDRLEDTNRTLVAKLNRQIEKKRDRLRISLTATLSRHWSKWTQWLETTAPREAVIDSSGQ